MNAHDHTVPYLDQLSTFAHQNRLSRWSGRFAQFMEQVLSQAPYQHARTSHQYLWCRLRLETERATFSACR
jgi:serine protein kinase